MKESTTIMFVLTIIVGGLYSNSLSYNTEATKTILQKDKEIKQLNYNASVLNQDFEEVSQANFILRSYIKGKAERDLLNDDEYVELINVLN